MNDTVPTYSIILNWSFKMQIHPNIKCGVQYISFGNDIFCFQSGMNLSHIKWYPILPYLWVIWSIRTVDVSHTACLRLNSVDHLCFFGFQIRGACHQHGNVSCLIGMREIRKVKLKLHQGHYYFQCWRWFSQHNILSK